MDSTRQLLSTTRAADSIAPRIPPGQKNGKKNADFGRIQAMSLPGRFKLDDSASNELVGVKFYEFFCQTI